MKRVVSSALCGAAVVGCCLCTGCFTSSEVGDGITVHVIHDGQVYLVNQQYTMTNEPPEYIAADMTGTSITNVLSSVATVIDNLDASSLVTLINLLKSEN